MPTPKRGPRLGAGPAHQKLMLSNLASDLFRHGRITTTQAKAKTLRPYAEKLITKAKAGDLPARRQVLAKLRDRDVVAYLFEDVAPRFVDRNGGYTRILKLGPRPGDNAPMAVIELVEQGATVGDEVITEGKQSRSRGLFGRRRKRTGEAAAAAADQSAFFADDDAELDEPSDETSEEAPAADATAASDETSADVTDGVEAPAGDTADEVEAEDTSDEDAPR